MDSSDSSDLKLYRQIIRRARPYWLHLCVLFLLGLLSAPLALLTPLPLKIVIDSVLGGLPLPGFLAPLLPSGFAGETALLLLALGILLGATMLGQLLDMASACLRTVTGQKLVLDFRAELFRCVQRLSFAHTDSRGTADLNYRIQQDAPALQSIAVDGPIPMISAAVSIASMLWVAMRIDWQLALTALGICPFLFLTTGYYRPRLRSQSREVRSLESAALSVIHEVLGAIRVVKAFGQEDREEKRFFSRSKEGVQAKVRQVITEGTFGMVLGLVMAGGTAAILFVGVRHVQAGILSLGDLFLVVGYLAQLYTPIKTLSRKMARMQTYLTSAERAFALLGEAPDVVEQPHARRLERARGHLVFQNVRFAYDAGHGVLDDLSMEVPPGTCAGIIGVTGAGKTTLVSLLPRFYDPTSGAIFLDGVDLRDYKLADLRRQFAIVLQEPVLFSATITENIAYARPEASQSEIIAAATAAGAHEFIARLPQGYDTLVGERGMRLSGGERQRISLARAFLKDAPILVLDEPTSSVDARTEGSILETLSELLRGRTVILITHRQSALGICDQVLRMADGRIADQPHATGATL